VYFHTVDGGSRGPHMQANVHFNLNLMLMLLFQNDNSNNTSNLDSAFLDTHRRSNKLHK